MELMVKSDPEIYREYMMIEKGRQVLYLYLQKALYDMMKSALLFYRKLIKELKEMGIGLDPYDLCMVQACGCKADDS
jgi:hypothetical protein